MTIELENVGIRPVKGGYIVTVNTIEEYEDDEGEKHSDWNSEEFVALTEEDALTIVKDNLT